MFKLKSIFLFVQFTIKSVHSKRPCLKKSGDPPTPEINFLHYRISVHMYENTPISSYWVQFIGWCRKSAYFGRKKFNFHYSWLFFSYDVGRLYWFIHIVVLMTSENIDSCYFYCHRIIKHAVQQETQAGACHRINRHAVQTQAGACRGDLKGELGTLFQDQIQFLDILRTSKSTFDLQFTRILCYM